MNLPNLIIPGASKSGTSTFHELLNQHDDIFMSWPKEPHFFSNDDLFEHGTAFYSTLFKDAETASVLGESSTTYMLFPDVAQRIKSVLEDPRIIFLLRNPIDRAESHFRWLKELELEDRPFRTAFLSDIKDTPSFDDAIGGSKFRFYALESRYGFHYERFERIFGVDRIMIITFEEMNDRLDSTLQRCADFLGIHPFSEITPVWENATPDKTGGRITNEERLWLRQYFSEDVAHLRKQTGRGFSEWDTDFPVGHD